MVENKKQKKHININWGAIIGVVVAAAVAIVIVVSNTKKNETEPWWSGIDRLKVTKCSNTYCTDGTTSVQKVLYSGFFSIDSEDKNMNSMLSAGIKMLDVDALAVWSLDNDDYDVKGKRGAYRFELLSEDQKSKIEAWGYCINKGKKQECIAFSSSAQYRIKP